MIRKGLLLAITFFFIISCDKENFVDPDSVVNEQSVSGKEDFSVSLDEALQYAEAFSAEGDSIANGRLASKKVKNSFSISEDDSELMHVVNYEDNAGFIIVSADTRIQPILAFSEENNFSEVNSTSPCGLKIWVGRQAFIVDSVRRNNSAQSETAKKLWDDYRGRSKGSKGSSSSRTTNNQCPYYAYEGQTYSEVTTKGPLLQTRWGQGVGYNNSCPQLGCSAYSNGRAPAGCVATATGQIMRYHEHPNYVIWSSMPNTTGSTQASALLRDIGARVDMDYKCSGSSSSTGDAADVLRDDYEYSSASYTNYSHYTVKSEINNNYPVILRGRNSNGGHAWVCDGYRSTEYYECQDDPYGDGLIAVSTYGTLYLHMVWGWEDDYVGYYGFNNWNPGNRTYNDYKKMITNIRP